ncbi:hypothetical protein H6F90_15860 [Trichocoleus sp. FACHB-591]|uniref:hypothetical protein n=1 Tax=Trichocoleus sp. FACHB-591 TaxID=2692872 RepID=UPI0016886147|nr:hypothetical protein [Trichocoleus sp. FACHB-591]MBD2096609.1 hypothetical protein [Trichocoleus sp. FACHB-591]
MTIQKLPLEAVQKVRQYIKSNLALPESENYPKPQTLFDTSEEPPEPESLDALGDLFKFASLPEEETPSPNTEGHWFVSAVNPGSTLLKLPGLKLKPNFRLAGYLYRVPEGGAGSIWALPEEFSTTAQLEQALAASGDRAQPPQPSGALVDFMEAVEGDRSPSSYLVASILRRELQEFGVLGKYCEWSHHHLINTIPLQIKWQWRKAAPKDLIPKVASFPDGRVAVEFFTCRVVPPVAIFRHLDQYVAGTYKATCADQALAIKV